MPKRETFPAARERLLAGLAANGWIVRSDLKYPWAKHPNYDFRVNFKAQAVYLDEHSLFIDIRGMSLQEFVNDIALALKIRNEP